MRSATSSRERVSSGSTKAREAPITVPPRVGSSSGISVKSGFRCTWGTWGLSRLEKPLMKPNTSTRRWLARTTAPWMVAFKAGVSPPAVRIPMRFIHSPGDEGTRAKRQFYGHSRAAPRRTLRLAAPYPVAKKWRRSGLCSKRMGEKGYELIRTADGAPIKAWVKGVPFDPKAAEQLRNTARLPFVFKWVAAMPDVHWGLGATVGSVLPTKGAIVPAAVGVDIGCGMAAVRTSLRAGDLPDDLGGVRAAIERAVPHGFTPGRGRDRGSWESTARPRRASVGSAGRGIRAHQGPPPEVRPRSPPRGPARDPGQRQPLHRGVPGRGRPGLVPAPQRVAGGGEPHRHLLHRARARGDAEAGRAPARPRPRVPARGDEGLRRLRGCRGLGAVVCPGQSARDDGRNRGGGGQGAAGSRPSPSPRKR